MVRRPLASVGNCELAEFAVQATGAGVQIDEMPGVRAMRERRPAHVAFHIHGLDGIVRPIEATAIPLESARGHVLGAFVVLWAQDAANTVPREET